GLEDPLGLGAQQRDLVFRETIRKEQIAEFIEFGELLRRELHDVPRWWRPSVPLRARPGGRGFHHRVDRQGSTELSTRNSEFNTRSMLAAALRKRATRRRRATATRRRPA